MMSASVLPLGIDIAIAYERFHTQTGANFSMSASVFPFWSIGNAVTIVTLKRGFIQKVLQLYSYCNTY